MRAIFNFSDEGDKLYKLDGCEDHLICDNVQEKLEDGKLIYTDQAEYH